MSVQIKYDPKPLTFFCSIIAGHLQEGGEKKIFEFKLPMARVEEERQLLKKDGKYFALFDYAFFEGTPFEVYYLGFSNTTITSSTNKRIKRKYYCTETSHSTKISFSTIQIYSSKAQNYF